MVTPRGAPVAVQCDRWVVPGADLTAFNRGASRACRSRRLDARYLGWGTGDILPVDQPVDQSVTVAVGWRRCRPVRSARPQSRRRRLQTPTEQEQTIEPWVTLQPAGGAAAVAIGGGCLRHSAQRAVSLWDRRGPDRMDSPRRRGSRGQRSASGSSTPASVGAQWIVRWGHDVPDHHAAEPHGDPDVDEDRHRQKPSDRTGPWRPCPGLTDTARRRRSRPSPGLPDGVVAPAGPCEHDQRQQPDHVPRRKVHLCWSEERPRSPGTAPARPWHGRARQISSAIPAHASRNSPVAIVFRRSGGTWRPAIGQASRMEPKILPFLAERARSATSRRSWRA